MNVAVWLKMHQELYFHSWEESFYEEIECQSRSQTEIKLTKTKSIFTLECSGIFKSDLSDTQTFENR